MFRLWLKLGQNIRGFSVKKKKDPMDSVGRVKTSKKWLNKDAPASLHTFTQIQCSPGSSWDAGWGLDVGEGEGEVVVRCQIKCHLLLCQWSNSLLKAWPFDPGGARPIAQCSHEVITNDSSEGGWRGVHGAQCWTHPGPVSPKRGCVRINYKPLTLSESLILQFG